MKKLWLSAALLVGTLGCADAQSSFTSIISQNSAPVVLGPGSTTELIPAKAGQRIYVTAYDLTAAGTATVLFNTGTGSVCGTSTVALSGAYSLSTTIALQRGSGIAPLLFGMLGGAVCVTTTGAVGVAGSISYAQF